jgi:glycosyltransferase involved in cell wall biosynthesis
MSSVVHLDTSREWRGGQLQVYLLHRELVRKGVPSRLLARAGGALQRRCEEAGLPVEPIPLMRPWYPPAMRAVVRSTGDAAIVHAHDSHAVTLAAAARAANPRLSVVCHRRTSYSLRGSPATRWKYRRVDRWIAVSEEIAEKLRCFGVVDPVVLPSAVDVEGLRTEQSGSDVNVVWRELGISPGARVVALVGALVPQKGHHVLLEAATRILAAAPDSVFLIAGEGRLGEHLRSRVRRLGLAGAFRFAGFRRDVAALLNLSTVVVVPSVGGEGSSAVIKEAMVLGKPVVASNLPSNLEVLEDSGATVAVGDAGALAQAVVGLLEDSRRRIELGLRGTSGSERWLPDRMAAGVIAAYRGLGRSVELVLEAV